MPVVSMTRKNTTAKATQERVIVAARVSPGEWERRAETRVTRPMIRARMVPKKYVNHAVSPKVLEVLLVKPLQLSM